MNTKSMDVNTVNKQIQDQSGLNNANQQQKNSNQQKDFLQSFKSQQTCILFLNKIRLQRTSFVYNVYTQVKWPKKIACGNEHTVILTECGQITMKGNDLQGQIRTDLVDKMQAAGKRASNIACGEESTLIIYEDGTMVKFGNVPEIEEEFIKDTFQNHNLIGFNHMIPEDPWVADPSVGILKDFDVIETLKIQDRIKDVKMATHLSVILTQSNEVVLFNKEKNQITPFVNVFNADCNRKQFFVLLTTGRILIYDENFNLLNDLSNNLNLSLQQHNMLITQISSQGSNLAILTSSNTVIVYNHKHEAVFNYTFDLDQKVNTISLGLSQCSVLFANRDAILVSIHPEKESQIIKDKNIYSITSGGHHVMQTDKSGFQEGAGENYFQQIRDEVSIDDEWAQFLPGPFSDWDSEYQNDEDIIGEIND